MRYGQRIRIWGIWAVAGVILLAMAVIPAGCDRGGDEVQPPDSAGAGQESTTGTDTTRRTSSTTSITTSPAVTFDPARLGTVEQDVTYGTAGGQELKLDVYYPKTASGPTPAVMYVHGGGWTAGDKSLRASDLGMFQNLVDAGFLVVSVNYRLAPDWKFPAQIQDVKCAVRYLRANASRYNIDPDRIGAIGGSAGGHLVALLGVTDGDEGLEGDGGNPGQSSRVQAVVDMFGPTDLTVVFAGGPVGRRLGTDVFGTTDATAAILRQASPVTYASNDDPPFLILHGEQDDLVPPSQSREFYDRLLAAGVSAQLVMVSNAGHGFVPQGGLPSPSRAEISNEVESFFRETLK